MTPFLIASRFEGEIREIPGAAHHPLIQWAHHLGGLALDTADEVAWCGSFVALIAWLFDLPRPRVGARARAWLPIGTPVALLDAAVGFDVVVLTRGPGVQPGPEVAQAPGHVGFFAGRRLEEVCLLGGNQTNSVTRAWFPASRVLGVRRLAEGRPLVQ